MTIRNKFYKVIMRYKEQLTELLKYNTISLVYQYRIVSFGIPPLCEPFFLAIPVIAVALMS